MAGINETGTITLKLLAQDLASGNIGKFIGNLDKAAKQSGLLGWAVKGAALSMGSMLNPAALVAQGIGAVTDVLGDAIGAASDLSETQSKLDQVFKTSAGTVRDWAEDSAQSMGLSKQAALEAAGTFGNFLEAMGKAEPEAAQMSTTMVQLAGDLASFNNEDPTAVLDALRSGLAGETEPLRRFGVDISDAAVKMELVAEGAKKVGKDFTQAQKIQGRYALIMKQTVTAQGDFARTADGMANSQRTLNAELENAKAKLGDLLLGPATTFTQFLIGAIELITGEGGMTPAMHKMTEEIKKLHGAMQDGPQDLRTWADAIAEWEDRLRTAPRNMTDEWMAARDWLKRLGPQFLALSEDSQGAWIDMAMAAQKAGLSFEQFRSRAFSVVNKTTAVMEPMVSAWMLGSTAMAGAAKKAGNVIEGPNGPAAAVRHTVRQMHQTLANASAPWKAEWQKLAAWAKAPFQPNSFENWLHARIKAAIRKANDPSLDKATRARWRHVANLMKNPVVAAGLQIGLTVDQALADIALVTATAKTLSDTIANIVLSPLGGLHGGSHPTSSPRPRSRPRNNNSRDTSDNRPPDQGPTVNVQVSAMLSSESDADRVARALAPAIQRHLTRQAS